MATRRQPCVLLTGATGFLGKVVLEELCRQNIQGTLPTHKVLLLIRRKAGKNIQERFDEMSQSICFSGLDEKWTANVHLVEGDLQAQRCGLPLDSYLAICSQVTHIIHCAASVEFDMSLAKAASANIDSCMNMLSLAQDCPYLQQMVSTSTAYVTPHTTAPIKPELAPLPESAESLYGAIRSNAVDEKKLLRSSRQPNTYTVTKCIAENLISTRKAGSLPVTIVRPSIISAAWKYPFAGWLDSRAAVGGFMGLLGAGYLHVLDGKKDARLDIVPVDQVANDLIREARLSSYHRHHDQADLHPEASESKTKPSIKVTVAPVPTAGEAEENEDEDNTPMIHLKAGPPNIPLRIVHSTCPIPAELCSSEAIIQTCLDYFTQQHQSQTDSVASSCPDPRDTKTTIINEKVPSTSTTPPNTPKTKTMQKPSWSYIGPRHTWRFHYHNLTKHVLPLALAELYFHHVKRDKTMVRKVQGARRALEKVDAGFPYFSTNTFVFVTESDDRWCWLADFTAREYLLVICRGVHRHLLLGEK
ncbi:hypothetical protein LTR10_019187 [Elasticomyces elasticus]|uniref:Fatty acyl-CoA reductase n=1 Tax=Exophiala sideris TaxID=1016849 RepID=A0ABR0J8W4_9EURO|nr:hypothetical protein LTR10_019187 [Elasticomyces elasticus]KAK5025507.1 hypothetical protein LTR13_010471 [Exophiala sideris]KAK5029780.1 hypothetical protein LTS07_005504 [Exophiala sideris]KAK5058458.1 hypothetical protein LTR69_006863 [Exophiala sideris]KAK5178569.1 hypothetical protein LTR44_008940 [Eurotiomycetes sp. CCFEE 6388]